MSNNKKIKKGLFFVGFLAAGLAFGYFAGGFLAEAGDSLGFIDLTIKDTGWNKYILIGTFVLMTLSVLAIHELGHLITGLVYGFKFLLFIVGPLGVKRTEDDKIRPYFNTNLGMAGGLAATFPTILDSDNSRKFANVILAGPLTSILSVPVALAIAVFVPPPWPFLFTFMAIMSFLIFLATTIPSKSGVFYTDRKRYQRLKSNGIEREIELAMLTAGSLKMTGQSMTGIAISQLEKIKLDDSPMIKYIGLIYEYEYYISMDKSKLESIREQLDATAEYLPKSSAILFKKELDKLENVALTEVNTVAN